MAFRTIAQWEVIFHPFPGIQGDADCNALSQEIAAAISDRDDHPLRDWGDISVGSDLINRSITMCADPSQYTHPVRRPDADALLRDSAILLGSLGMEGSVTMQVGWLVVKDDDAE